MSFVCQHDNSQNFSDLVQVAVVLRFHGCTSLAYLKDIILQQTSQSSGFYNFSVSSSVIFHLVLGVFIVLQIYQLKLGITWSFALNFEQLWLSLIVSFDQRLPVFPKSLSFPFCGTLGNIVCSDSTCKIHLELN